MNLFDILNDETMSAEISNNITIKLMTKDFWKNDEQMYISVLVGIEKEHLSIRMSQEKYNTMFTM